MTNERNIPERVFPSTNWDMVNQAGDRNHMHWAPALDKLVRQYLPALMAHLVNIKNIPADRAEDLLQSFLSEKIITGQLLPRADQNRGKFRSFLLTALDHHTASVFRREQAAKRSPGAEGHVNLDEIAHELPAAGHSHAMFDLVWARQLVDDALNRVRLECESSGRAAYWMIFEARVVGPILHGTPPEGYSQLARRTGISSPMQASNALVTAKRMFERNLRAAVLDYAGDESAVDKEIFTLRAILGELSG